MRNDDLDNMIGYLFATGQLDDNFGLKDPNQSDDDNDDDEEEEDE